MRVELAVDGAKAEPLVEGARLVLTDGGRRLNYHRLRVADANGRELTAKLEVLTPNRMAVVLDDATADYPIRIDPTFSDANWLAWVESPARDNPVLAAVVDGTGNLYIGGHFHRGG